MKNYQGRHRDLKSRINKHLQKLTGLDKDFYATIKQADLFELKTALSDINNVLTLRLTVSASKWLCNFFKLSATTLNDLLATVDNTKPNTNGFDIQLNGKKKIIAEVKCIVPINNGGKYGGAQWNAILGDAVKLQKGTKALPDTSDYIKFLILADLGERTDNAITQLLRQSKGTSEKPLRVNRHKIKDKIILLKDQFKVNKLTTDKIYIKTIK